VPKGTRVDGAGVALTEIASVADLLRFGSEAAPSPARRATIES
jgi:hypothetical protein